MPLLKLLREGWELWEERERGDVCGEGSQDKRAVMGGSSADVCD